MKTSALIVLYTLGLAQLFGQSNDISIQKDSINSTNMGYVMNYYVHVPNNYISQQNNKFNVIYLLDGNPQSKLFDLVRANFSYPNNDWYFNFPPFILVGIDPKNRSQEFTPETNDIKTVNNYLFKTYGYGRADDFLNFLQHELFPRIEKEYNVTNHRLGIGHSLGGTFLMYALNTRPSLFNAYFLFSPNLEYGNKQLVKTFATLGIESVKDNFLYISIGDDPNYESKFKPAIENLDSAIRTKDYQNFICKIDYLTHCNHSESPQISLPPAISEYKKLYQWPSVSQREYFLSNAKGYLDEIKNYYKEKTKILGYQYEPGIDIINNEFVYYALDKNKMKEALEVINWGIELYPDNYFTHSLYLTKSYVLEKMDANKAAIESCKVGLTILKSNKEKMYPEDYQYAFDDLTNRMNELLNQNSE
jgi:predicted alpha/beta superfamily hydrolase